MARTRRVRVSGRFYIMLLALAILIGAAALIIPARGSGTLKGKTMEAVLTPEVAIIREENCVPIEQFDMVDYLINEGATVNAEMPVATVYKWGYTDEMAQSLVTIQQKIYEKQLSILDGIESTELASVNAQITELRSSIKDCVNDKNDSDLLSLERDMEALLSQRATILKNFVQPDVDLNSLYTEESTKLTQLAEYTSTVSAKMTGVVSFYFDGFEQILSAEKLDMVNADVLEMVFDGDTGGSTASSGDMLYRLVNPNRWYAAFLTPASEGLRLLEGQSYHVTFDGIHGKTGVGVALAPVAYDGGVVNILQFDEDIGELLSVRTVNAHISATMTGYEVPADAVKVKDGVCTLATDGGDIAVDPVAAGEDTLLITGAALYEGLRFNK